MEFAQLLEKVNLGLQSPGYTVVLTFHLHSQMAITPTVKRKDLVVKPGGGETLHS